MTKDHAAIRAQSREYKLSDSRQSTLPLCCNSLPTENALGSSKKISPVTLPAGDLTMQLSIGGQCTSGQ